MNNNVLVSWSVNIITKLTLLLVALILLYKIYIKIRSRFNIKVNCWFCNQNSKVPYEKQNCWTCPGCEQYNGFNKDGDYNREILQQYEDKLNSSTHRPNNSVNDSSLAKSPNNGFCNECNEAQRLKMEKLAQFEPEKESRFDQELKAYKSKLENKYRLCASCERHLKKVLHEKKRMILGSKFLHFILKNAEGIKHAAQTESIKFVKRQQLKKRFSVIIMFMAVINALCLSEALPAVLTHEKLISIFGLTVGQQLFTLSSHLMAAWKVLMVYLQPIQENEIIVKCILFLRTIFLMLLYSMGLSLPYITRLNFASIYTTAAPFAILCATFCYNLMDFFKVSRYLLLLVLWSTYAGGVVDAELFPAQKVLMFCVSLLTVLLMATTRKEISPKLRDSKSNSFHKMHSSDYLSDEDSLFSDELDYSNMSLHGDSFSLKSSASARDFDANQTFCGVSPSSQTQPRNRNGFSLNRSPLTSSMLSLNLSSNKADRSARPSNSSLHRPLNSPFNGSTLSTCQNYANKTTPLDLFDSSNLELNSSFRAPQQQRAHSVLPISNSSNWNGSNSTFILNNSFSHENNSIGSNSLWRTATPTLGYSTFNIPNSAHQDQRTFLINNTQNVTPASASPIYSSFQAGSNASINHHLGSNISTNHHHLESPPSLLSPSRLSTTSFLKASSKNNLSWISSGYLNKTHVINRADCSFGDHSNRTFTKSNSSLLCNAFEENLSRTSSQSSGFESQDSGRVNPSRENSHNRELQNESSELLQRTLTLETPPTSAFTPLDPTGCGKPGVDLSAAPLRRLPLNSSFQQPLNVDCDGMSNSSGLLHRGMRSSSVLSGARFTLPRRDDCHPLAPLQHRTGSSIKPGDLLRKWKETQTQITSS